MGACNCKLVDEICSAPSSAPWSYQQPVKFCNGRLEEDSEFVTCQTMQNAFAHGFVETNDQEYRNADLEHEPSSDSEGSYEAEDFSESQPDEPYNTSRFKKMGEGTIVAVDIDDTLVLTVNAFKKLVDSKNGSPMFSRWSEYQREMQCASSKWRKFAIEAGLFDDLRPVPGAKKGLEVLAHAGIRLEAMTSRPESLRDVTMELLDEYFPEIFSDVHFTGGREPKGVLCQRHGIHVLIDDSMEWLQDANERGVRCILFDFKGTYGSTQNPPKGISRAESWEDVSQLIFPVHASPSWSLTNIRFQPG